MTRDEAKAIVDDGARYLRREGSANQFATRIGLGELLIGPDLYLVVYENGAGGNLYTTNDFDEAWALFERLDTPIEIISHGQGAS
jgi:hypothetical protein